MSDQPRSRASEPRERDRKGKHRRDPSPPRREPSPKRHRPGEEQPGPSQPERSNRGKGFEPRLVFRRRHNDSQYNALLDYTQVVEGELFVSRVDTATVAKDNKAAREALIKAQITTQCAEEVYAHVYTGLKDVSIALQGSLKLLKEVAAATLPTEQAKLYEQISQLQEENIRLKDNLALTKQELGREKSVAEVVQALLTELATSRPLAGGSVAPGTVDYERWRAECLEKELKEQKDGLAAVQAELVGAQELVNSFEAEKKVWEREHTALATKNRELQAQLERLNSKNNK